MKKIRKAIMPFLLKNVWYVNMSDRKSNDAIFSTVDIVRNMQIEKIINEIKYNGVNGSIAELGVYKGNLSKIISECFKTTDKKYYLFDTFEGFDDRDKIVEYRNKYSKSNEDFSDTSVDKVLKKINYKNAVIKKGYFPETIDEEIEKDRFCFVSIDVDLAKPTEDGLNYFWPKLENGGYIIVHDYDNKEYKGVKAVTDKFIEKEGIKFHLELCDYCNSMILKKI